MHLGHLPLLSHAHQQGAGSGAAGTRASTHVGYWCWRQRLNLLSHGAGPHAPGLLSSFQTHFLGRILGRLSVHSFIQHSGSIRLLHTCESTQSSGVWHFHLAPPWWPQPLLTPDLPQVCSALLLMVLRAQSKSRQSWGTRGTWHPRSGSGCPKPPCWPNAAVCSRGLWRPCPSVPLLT